MGTARELFPPGIEDIRDMPYRAFEAIRMGMIFLSWEEMPADERPPKRMWLDDERLKAWFDDVKRNRERESGSSGAGPIEDPVQNEIAAKMKGF